MKLREKWWWEPTQVWLCKVSTEIMKSWERCPEKQTFNTEANITGWQVFRGLLWRCGSPCADAAHQMPPLGRCQFCLCCSAGRNKQEQRSWMEKTGRACCKGQGRSISELAPHCTLYCTRPLCAPAMSWRNESLLYQSPASAGFDLVSRSSSLSVLHRRVVLTSPSSNHIFPSSPFILSLHFGRLWKKKQCFRCCWGPY